MLRTTFVLTVSVLLVVSATVASAADSGLKQGTPDLKAAGPLAFGPDGVLFIGDPQSAAVFAVDTRERAGNPSRVAHNIEAINKKIASLLGSTPKDIRINDLAVNPENGNVFLSVSRGSGADAMPAILRVDRAGKLSELSLRNVSFARTSLPNPPPESATGRRGRRESITDLAFLDGQLIIAGLSNEEFASKLRTIPFPFRSADSGTSVEIFHGSHGKFETRSPVRTFVPYEINGQPHLLAAYTCTPLVKFPIAQLKSGSKIRGITLAELGNRNRPLDMIVYEKGGRDFVLLANNKRGVMKINTQGIDKIDGITEKVPGRETAGLPYETISSIEGVVQLDRLNNDNAVVLVDDGEGSIHLETVALP